MATELNFVVHDDNATDVDLLGFDLMAEPIVEAITASSVRPLTVGLRGVWGSGKSSLLLCVRRQLKEQGDAIVVEVDPWEYESTEQLRGALAEAVLLALLDELPADDADKDRRKVLVTNVRRLIGRVRLGRIATSVMKSAVTIPVDGGLSTLFRLAKGVVANVDELVADPEVEASDEVPSDMRGFREEFGRLIADVASHCGKKKVVVLVDDLDRCLPATVVESLEMIKLFMSVDHMVFVIAADEAMVRSALAAHVSGSGRIRDADISIVNFANQYLEKIVQLPLTIPFLTMEQAEVYATLLLCSAQLDDALFTELLDHWRAARQEHQNAPLATFAKADRIREWQELAGQVCAGMTADKRMRPRQIKRFMNALVMRRRIAADRGIKTMNVAVMAKLLLLEEQDLDSFRVLVERSGSARGDLLREWESWATGATETKPDTKLSEASKSWAAASPSLVEEDIAEYLTLAASLASQMTAGVFDERVAFVAQALLSDAQSVRENSIKNDVPELDESQLRQVVQTICERAPVAGASRAVWALLRIAEVAPAAAELIVDRIDNGLLDGIELSNYSVLALSKSAVVKAYAKRLETDLRLDEATRDGLIAVASVEKN